MRFKGKLSNIIMGSAEKFTFRQRAYNASTFAAAMLAFCISIGDSALGIGLVSGIFTICLSAVFFALYYHGRSKGSNIISNYAFYLIGCFAIFYDWFLFYGIRGTTAMIAIFIALVIPLISTGRDRLFMGGILVIIFSSLFLAEYFNWAPIENYPTKVDHIVDLYISATIFMVCVFALIGFTMKNYDQKKNLVDQYNKQLQEANKSVQEALDTRNKFFSIISHDLRNPVAALSSLAEILYDHEQNDDLSKKEYKEIVNGIKKSSYNALALLDNLLQWSRAETGKLKPELEWVALQDIVQHAVGLYASSASKKEITIKALGIEGKPVKAYSDAKMLNLVIRNLLSNAIKFTAHKGLIVIEQFSNENQVGFAVVDNGIGMTHDDQRRIFDLDHSTSARGTNDEVGTGLGLKLCKQFIDLLNGTIEVSSKAGAGTTFTVILPKNSKKSKLANTVAQNLN
ncbi:MAG: HAMP domain-containing histidine kinase [Bacteroidetes bacterium]|nr:HAMP domain-containing histidine kinase [Bacteroidota bacterium]